MISVIFCDDNTQYLDTLRNFIQDKCLNKVSKEDEFLLGPAFGSGKEVLEYIKDHHVDVLLLDIDMPDMSGFDVARFLCKEYKHIKIVFMSAYDNFVYSSFDFYPFAYLRKTHISQELPGVLNRIVEKIHEPEMQVDITTKLGLKHVNVSSIVYVESKRNYYSVYLVQGKEYLCRGTLTQFENELSKYNFFRIHSAFLVNLAYVERMPQNGYLLVRNKELPISQKRIKDFKKIYMDYVRGDL